MSDNPSMPTPSEVAAGYDAIADHIFESPSFYADSLALAPNVRGAVLDVGCGQGRFLEWLATYRPYVQMHGCEISPRLASMAATRVPAATIQVADALTLEPYADASFDYVFHLGVLEHLTDHRAALQSVHRVLKPGGVLVLVVPNRDWLRYTRWAALHTQVQPIDDYWFRVDELIELVTESGFTVKRVRGVWAIVWSDWRHYLERFAAFLFPPLRRRMKCVGLRCRR